MIHKYVNIKVILAVLYTTTVVKNKAWKKSGLYGNWTHDLCNTGAALYQLS